MEITKQREYISPVLDLIELNLEKGFAATGDPGQAGGNLGENGSWDW